MINSTSPEEFRIIPLRLCLEPVNCREDLDEALMQRMTDSIRKDGFLQPLRCVPESVTGDEWYRVVAGWTRVLCGLRAGKQEAPAIIIGGPLNETDDLIQKIIENDLRGATSIRDRIRWYYRLLELNKQWTQADLAKAVSARQADVSKTLKISKNLPAQLLEHIGEGEGKLPVRAAYALAGLDDAATLMDLAEKVMKRLMTVDALEEHIARLKKSKKPRQKLIRGKTPKGLVFTLPADCVAAQAEVVLLMESLKKAEKLGLPMSSVPALLRAK